MEAQEFLSAMKSGRMSRRDILQMLTAAGLTMTMLPVGRAKAADGEAIYFTWEGYNDPGFHPGYTAKNGAEPEGPVFGDVEEALTQVRSGFTVDVVHPCNLDLKRWRDADVLQPIDTSRLTNFANLFPGLTKLPYAQGAGIGSDLEDRDYGFTGGAGAGGSCFINEKIFLNVEYELLWCSNSYYRDGILSTISLGLGLRF